MMAGLQSALRSGSCLANFPIAVSVPSSCRGPAVSWETPVEASRLEWDSGSPSRIPSWPDSSV